MIVTITGDNYIRCADAASDRWSNSKTGAYGKGAINSITDPHRAERIGLLGEQAYAIYFDKDVDFSYRYGGDEQDFKLGPFQVDVKTTYMVDRALIRIFSAGKKYPLRSDVYVFCRMVEENKINKTATIDIVGWTEKENIKTAPIEPGKGDWLNHVVYFHALHNVEELKLLKEIIEKSLTKSSSKA